ncbi:hypothetical protein RHMOL_Rhmol03G0173200 [Rhododendron molle]|uniref:Uncharacterized protein n=1 Tax=Rhododendron molle TaxID=49168 RepID=A0ACC0PFR3_RHOML|nr:hypothetical protein RHMOL_Rhmol03G0173200 [Rhododendron molle]
MDCSICTTLPFILRPPRNTICPACYEGARSLIALTNKLDNIDKGADKSSTNSSSTTVSSPKSSKVCFVFLISSIRSIAFVLISFPASVIVIC